MSKNFKTFLAETAAGRLNIEEVLDEQEEAWTRSFGIPSQFPEDFFANLLEILQKTEKTPDYSEQIAQLRERTAGYLTGEVEYQPRAVFRAKRFVKDQLKKFPSLKAIHTAAEIVVPTKHREAVKKFYSSQGK